MKKAGSIQIFRGDPPAQPDDPVVGDPVVEINYYERYGKILRSVTKPHRGKQQGDK